MSYFNAERDQETHCNLFITVLDYPVEHGQDIVFLLLEKRRVGFWAHQVEVILNKIVNTEFPVSFRREGARKTYAEAILPFHSSSGPDGLGFSGRVVRDGDVH